MQQNPLRQLNEQGQSVWYDNVARGLIENGTIRRLVEQDGVSGLTSNPTIFEKAIGGGSDYDDAIRRAMTREQDPLRVFEAIAVEDIQQVADILRPTYDRTNALDGYACLEVAPKWANDPEQTVEEARRLWRELNRPNVMVKVPGTAPCLPAITTLLGEGINVNVTLLFDVDNYALVANAYLDGLERLEKAGGDLSRVASVASFFVSRVDTAVDNQIEAKIKSAGDEATRTKLGGLLGKAAVANAKIAYQRFESIFGGDRFARLKAKGAQVQRPLWASTGTKNPAYSDVLYVENLIGPSTVNTMPQQTLDAFRDHGKVARTVDADVAEARRVWQELGEAGVDLKAVTEKLQVDGVKLFADSFDKLIDTVRQKSQAVGAAAD